MPKQAGSTKIPREFSEAKRQSGNRRHGSFRLVQSRSQRAWCTRKTKDGQVAQHPCRELAPAVSTTRTRYATLQSYAKFAEICLGPFLRLQPLQTGKIAGQPIHLQADTHRRSHRVVSTLFRIGSRFARQTETGSNSSNSTIEIIREARRLVSCS